LMVLGQGVTFLLPPAFQLAYAACFAMSVLYSVPPFRLKSVAGADWVINMWGFGAFTPFAGWASTGRTLDLPHALVLLGFCPLFAALYPLTQIYQVEEDTRRGDRTLVIRLGIRRSLGVAIAAALAAFALFSWSLVLLDHATSLRVAGLGLAFASWLGVLVPWARRYASMTTALHQRGMYLALGAWAVTDVVVALAWGT
ncbi:MAG: UbiA family prenyltransferase, partial [Gemmatimonadales bacterium]